MSLRKLIKLANKFDKKIKLGYHGEGPDRLYPGEKTSLFYDSRSSGKPITVKDIKEMAHAYIQDEDQVAYGMLFEVYINKKNKNDDYTFLKDGINFLTFRTSDPYLMGKDMIYVEDVIYDLIKPIEKGDVKYIKISYIWSPESEAAKKSDKAWLAEREYDEYIGEYDERRSDYDD